MKTGIIAQQSGKENPVNLLSNGDFENWSAGTAVAPDGWTLYGGGCSVAREASIIKLGTYSAKVTEGSGSTLLLYQEISATKGIAYWKGRRITYGAWVYATVANRAYVALDDGVSTVLSSYHTGGSTWEWLTATCLIDSSATRIQIRNGITAAADTSAYFDGAMCVEGESAFSFADKPVVYSDARYKMGSFTRVTDAVTADVSYTGIGFSPKLVIFFGGVNITGFGTYFGAYDGTSSSTVYNAKYNAAGDLGISTNAIILRDGGGLQIGAGKSLDADGFSITWTLSATPANATATIYYIAFR